jgi:hypothetical protein
MSEVTEKRSPSAASPNTTREKVVVTNEPEPSSCEWRFERQPRRGDVVRREDTGVLYKVSGRNSLGYLQVERFEKNATVEKIVGWEGPPVQAWLCW